MLSPIFLKKANNSCFIKILKCNFGVGGKIIDVILISTYFLKIVKNADKIKLIKELFDFYRTKLFPCLKNIDSNFMKLISRYSSEKP